MTPPAVPATDALLDRIDVVLHRPQSPDNVGAVARVMMNFGLRHMRVVSPKRWEPDRAKTLAAGADVLVDHAVLYDDLETAIAPHLIVVPTTERAVEGRPPPLGPRETARLLLDHARDGRVALLFGEEARGVSNALLDRFTHYSSIPSDPAKRSLNLAQAALLYAWELYQESGVTPPVVKPDTTGERDVPAPQRLVALTRTRLRKLMLANGFLNPDRPDKVMDELMRMLQRAQPSLREIGLVLAAIDQLERTSVQK